LEKSGLSTPILDGHTKARDTVISKARSASNPILIQAGISEGYEMPEIEHVIFASMDWSYKNYVQMLGRFLRINAPTPTVFHRLVAGPIDKKVLKAINNKKHFMSKTTTPTKKRNCCIHRFHEVLSESYPCSSAPKLHRK